MECAEAIAESYMDPLRTDTTLTLLNSQTSDSETRFARDLPFWKTAFVPLLVVPRRVEPRQRVCGSRSAHAGDGCAGVHPERYAFDGRHRVLVAKMCPAVYTTCVGPAELSRDKLGMGRKYEGSRR